MDDCLPLKNTGLRGVDVASSKICDVKGEQGKLIYRGFAVRDLARNSTFEEVCFLLLYERLPTQEQLEQFKADLISKRAIPENIFDLLKVLPKDMNPMDVLQAAVPLLGPADKTLQGESTLENALQSAKNLIAGIASITAAWDRIRNGKGVIEPDNSLSHAANFLYMLNDKKPEPEIERFFDACLILHAEHSFNASTFTARQVASTKAHMYAAVSAAIGSLSGPLHGGANVRVMKMLKEIGSKERIDGYINSVLESGGLIMGLGHAVYQTDDPRAKVLAPMSKRMGQIAGQPQWYELSRALELKAKAAFKAKKQRDIYCNVDFYSASLFHTMGIATDLFTPLFAVSRISGWAAHVIEEQYAMAAPRPSLYRPGADYIGEYCGPDECVYTDFENR
jgi:citrate synthase